MNMLLYMTERALYMSLKTLKWEDYSGLSRRAQSTPPSPLMWRTFPSCAVSGRRCGRTGLHFLTVKTKEGGQEPRNAGGP